MIKSIYISLFVFILICLVSIQTKSLEDSYVLKSNKSEFIAGEHVQLEFGYNTDSDVMLYCSNSYGSILLDPEISAKILKFNIPDSISKKSGVLNWKLIAKTNNLQGSINVKPKPSIKSLESYLGPPSIEAGGTDYTMLVVIPTDDLDNPMADSTKVQIKHQFLNNEISDTVSTLHGFTYKTINSYKESGRILISSECLDLNSKEYDVNVMPAIPTNFTIKAERIHNYADGNQITTFKTSQIIDRFNNVVSDGTFVTFFITDQNGNKTQTYGSTINGIATAKMLHPDHEEQWSVKAYIEGMANSETITLGFKQAISNFEAALSDDNRTITVGPLQSFMKQRVPDGLFITLSIYKNKVLVNEIQEQSYNGMANFYLSEDEYSNGSYHLEIETAGLSKTLTNITYE
ncbi:hypothetical protein [Winogradskyella vincentii]|uniref:Uncharacterized protein n=1 Tax=Winogradskyella vincentii TaxID=2877122 RepID=A0ABS7Y062_9FLAO|nr:hypothetical protein [Winogradskyella vincentii]MCA0152057.1 hypothetical protein [Winogradskyella vincentii]